MGKYENWREVIIEKGTCKKCGVKGKWVQSRIYTVENWKDTGVYRNVSEPKFVPYDRIGKAKKQIEEENSRGLTCSCPDCYSKLTFEEYKITIL